MPPTRTVPKTHRLVCKTRSCHSWNRTCSSIKDGGTCERTTATSDRNCASCCSFGSDYTACVPSSGDRHHCTSGSDSAAACALISVYFGTSGFRYACVPSKSSFGCDAWTLRRGRSCSVLLRSSIGYDRCRGSLCNQALRSIHCHHYRRTPSLSSCHSRNSVGRCGRDVNNGCDNGYGELGWKCLQAPRWISWSRPATVRHWSLSVDLRNGCCRFRRSSSQI